MPDWVQDAIWWQVHPLGFVGAERDAVDTVTHRLPRIVGWLDHLVALGCNGLALGPVFASSTHGYDTVDHLRVDPRLGDDADFEALVAAAHDKGVRVLLDGVFNHVGRAHPAFTDPARRHWFRWDGDEPAVFEGHGALVELDHTQDDVVQLVVDVMCHWLERGVDGWRLDAAYAVPPEFWARVLPVVRERFPEVYVVGEVIHGDYAGIVGESGMDAVTQYELWQGVWHGLAEGNLFETAHALQRHDGFLEAFVPWTFVGNHDVTRIVDQVGEPLLPHALVLLCTVGGTPAVWSGDEFGWHGIKEHRAGGDDAIRPEFPADPLAVEGGAVFALHQELVGLRRRHRWLHRARTEQLHLTNEQLVYRTAADGGALVVALNLADEPAVVPSSGELVAGRGEVRGRDLELPAHGWAVLAG
ncbi:cyclomaltodextrinase [Klenkia soli]|uniref:Cyclomaltodextrinase n=1 Tax=Klenkia soli TaxID=1052260 RepID=A0A1H0PW30_9ACTN|nr:alpha-amylase family glycosyl hydrolase [Klenkia soli]SDP09352.1 cyclomaltodextrinase [Klenkia soli]